VVHTARIEVKTEAIAIGNDIRPGELVFFREDVQFAREVADIGIPLPLAIKRLQEDYDVVGVAVYKGKVRVLLLPKRGRPVKHINKSRKERMADYMRRRYWLQNYGCEPPKTKGTKHGGNP